MPQASPAVLAAPPPAVRALLAEWGRAADDPRLEVDPGDEMLAFLRDLHGGDPEQALAAYYRSGASIAAVLLQVLRWRFGDAARVSSLLDFASGYGRVTRFLLGEVSAAAVTVADVLPGAVDFQRRTFGVRAATSAPRPEDLGVQGLGVERPFDAIFVTSLFTHLPEHRFAPWLAALLARLRPGGVLAFSTHDLALLPPEQRPQERSTGGCVFQPHSEIAELEVEDYGSTWVDEGFVRAALAAAGRPLAARRFDRALCNHQDLWVVVDAPADRDPSTAFASLALQSEPEVAIEECELGTTTLALAGWAHARHGTVTRIEAALDGRELGAAAVEHPRGDVAAALGPGAARSGWSLRLPLPAAATPLESVLLLRAVDASGGRHPIWVGRPLALALQARSLQAREARAALHLLRGELAAHRAGAEHEIGALRTTIGAMRASRFWKLRDAWFRLKRALRLTDEA